MAARSKGYQSDITRTFVLGKATDKMKKVFDIVQAGADRGAQGGAARRAARLDRRRRAEGDRRRWLRPRLQVLHAPPRTRHGHGRTRVAVPREEQHVRMDEGADAASPAWCSATSPGIYIRGEFGVRLEDDMHITDKRRRAVHAAKPIDWNPSAPVRERVRRRDRGARFGIVVVRDCGASVRPNPDASP